MRHKVGDLIHWQDDDGLLHSGRVARIESGHYLVLEGAPEGGVLLHESELSPRRMLPSEAARERAVIAEQEQFRSRAEWRERD